MARIAPERFPDRFAFERHAKVLRRQEFDRLMGAGFAWIRAHVATFAHPAASARAHARH